MSTHDSDSTLGDAFAEAGNPDGRMDVDGGEEFRDTALTTEDGLDDAFGQVEEPDSEVELGRTSDTDADPDDEGEADRPVEGSR